MVKAYSSASPELNAIVCCVLDHDFSKCPAHMLAPPDVLRALQAQADDDDDSDEESDEGEAGESEDEDEEDSDQEEVEEDDVRRVCLPFGLD